MATAVPGPPITSTQTQQTDGSTSALFAELDSTELAVRDYGKSVQVSIWVGASTVTEWQFEHCLSTGLGSTAIRERHVLRTATGQTSQFVRKVTLQAGSGERLRVRVATAHSGGNTGEAKLQVEGVA